MRLPVVYSERYLEAGYPELAYAREGDAGFDLRACTSRLIHIGMGDSAIIPTGIRVAIPEGLELQIRPRSGLAAKHGVTVLNAPGTIDSGFRGEIGVILINLTRGVFCINPGDRIAQAVLTRFEVAEFDAVSTLDETSRGEGGFGSSGR